MKQGASKAISISTIIKIVVAVAVAAVAVVGVKAVVAHVVDRPQKVVEDLEDAYNHRSLTEMVECLDPGSQALIDGFLGIAESYLGEDNLLEIADGLLKLSQYIDDEDLQDVQNSRLDLKSTHVEKDGDTAIVYFDMTMYVNDEVVIEDEGALPVVKVDGTWYIDGAQIAGSLY